MFRPSPVTLPPMTVKEVHRPKGGGAENPAVKRRVLDKRLPYLDMILRV